jgi:hypothetical protein
MKLSARNQLAGTIKTIKPGATTTHVTIEVATVGDDHGVDYQRGVGGAWTKGRDEGYGRHQGVQRDDRCGLSPRLGCH